MKYVGEAVSMLQSSTKVVAFGIAPWGTVMNKKELTARGVRFISPVLVIASRQGCHES